MIRVLICDDHALIRRGLAQLLRLAGGIEVIGEAANYGEARRALREGPCDVLVMDVDMPGKNGIEALGLLREEFPRLQALILSAFPEEQYAVRALRAGAAGYLNKAAAPEALVDAVRAAAAGRRYLSPEVSNALASAVAGDAPGAAHEALSERELQVLRMIAGGKRLSQIAEALAISPKTVSVYRARVLEKLNLANNVELAHYAAKHGLVANP